jgi:hypothetical protein
MTSGAQNHFYVGEIRDTGDEIRAGYWTGHFVDDSAAR